MDGAAPVSRQHAGDQATVKLQDAKPQAVISAQPSVLLSWRLVSVNRLRLSVLQTDLTTAVRDPVAPSKRPLLLSGERRSRGIRALADRVRAAGAAGGVIDREGGRRGGGALVAEPATGLVQHDPHLAVGRKLEPEAPRLLTRGSTLHDLHVLET